jgi:hypothetical protein
VKRFSWSAEKNQQLRRERGVCFEDVVFHIQQGDLLDMLEHPNRERFAHQRVFVVRIDDYAHLVPFVEDDVEIFLKTIIPSRQATRDYLGSREEP